MDKDEAQQLFEVSRHFVVEIKGAKLGVARATTIERGVCGHESQAHHPRTEGARAVVARHGVEIGRGYVVHIAVASIDLRVGERIGHAAEDVGVGIEIVAVEHAHHLTGGASNAFVHGVVESAVGFAEPAEAFAKLRCKFANDVGCVVCRSAVGYDKLEVGVRLSQERAEGVGEGGATVEGSGDNGDFHGRGAGALRRQRRAMSGKRTSRRNLIFARSE